MNANIFNSVDRVGVMGDTHGFTGWTMRAVRMFAEDKIQIILHVGDFGLWNDNSGRKYLYKVNKTLVTNNMIMLVTLGNHECYPMVDRFVESINFPGFYQLPDHDGILFLERGQRWTMNNVSFVSLGGANSINRSSLTPNIDWFAEEQISLGDVYRTVAGGSADVMITHDVPTGVPIFSAFNHHNPNEWSSDAVIYANKSRDSIRAAVDGVQPKLLLHGHYHVWADFNNDFSVGDDNYSFRSVGLDMQDSAENCAILDLSNLDIQVANYLPTSKK